MRVLFVPGHKQGAIAHGIPLLALSRRLDPSFVPAFLVPRSFWEFFRRRGADVLDIDHDELKTQMVAHGRFKPDVVVDDLSITTAFAHSLAPFPRVTIQRTGSFPGEAARVDGRVHSADAGLNSLPDVSWLGLPKSLRPVDLVKAEAVIVPGIRSVEVLPPDLVDKPGYFFSGPLVTDDVPSGRDVASSTGFEAVDAFLQRHAARKLVLFTFGTIALTPEHVKSCISRLLEQGIAVISTVAVESAARDHGGLFHHGEFLPLHRICSRASLMIHHCGSGTSQFPIIYNVPSITFGTGFHDRDDVALQLQYLGASIHFDLRATPAGHDNRFEEAVQAYLDETSPVLQSARAALARLKQEADTTSASFDLPRMLQHALNARAGRRAKPGNGPRPRVPEPVQRRW